MRQRLLRLRLILAGAALAAGLAGCTTPANQPTGWDYGTAPTTQPAPK